MLAPNSWKPTADWETLKKRAQLLQQIRRFFEERGVTEVQTPCLGLAGVTDPAIECIEAFYREGNDSQTLYLQSSPEYAMKRLLASGSGDIFQITKSFRNGEQGRLHHPEFSMLEWYRLGWDDEKLMDEIEALLQTTLEFVPAVRYDYASLFQNQLGFNIQTATSNSLKEYTASLPLHSPDWGSDKDAWLIFLFSTLIEPTLQQPTFVYDFPATQASLARIKPNGMAGRFELYANGMELGNGFWELTDPIEQEKRFLADQAMRQQKALPYRDLDHHFLAALQQGLPPCSGVALGIDRLMMLALHKTDLAEVISFQF